MSSYITISILLLSMFLFVGCGDSSAKKDLTNNPSAESVQEAISEIENVNSIEIVTEDNDPNEQLGKQGGYTGCLYFKSPLVKDETEESSITAGTDGGGCIEIYENEKEKDAQKRDEYLAAFDGGAFSSGSHKVIGTVIIRISSQLKASQQTELETNIVDALQAK